MGTQQRAAEVVVTTRMALILVIAAAAVGCASTPAPMPIDAPGPSGTRTLGTGPHVVMAEANLSDGEELTLHAARCQEVTVFVEAGAVLVGHTDPDARANRNQSVQPIWARTGQVFRFSRQTLTLASTKRGATRLFVVTARAPGSPFADDGSDISRPPCDSIGKATRFASATQSGPFERNNGRLKVMVYFEAGYASFGSLDGDLTLAVPEHLHETSAEVLYFRDGSGSMRVGGETLRITPGAFVYVPANTLHSFQPDGTRPVFAYQVYARPGPEQRFKK